jgi:hypothetical protein
LPTAWDRQIHPLGERAQGLYERAAVLYGSAAAIFRLPQDRSALAEALSKQPQVRYERREVTCEDAVDWSEAPEALGKTQARRRELSPSHESLSHVLFTRVEVTGCFGGVLCSIVADP